MLVAPVVIGWPMMIIFWCRLTQCSPIGKQEACADCCNIMYVRCRHHGACLEPHETLPRSLLASATSSLAVLCIFFWLSLLPSSVVMVIRLLPLLYFVFCFWVYKIVQGFLELNTCLAKETLSMNLFLLRKKNRNCTPLCAFLYMRFRKWHVQFQY